MLPWLPAATLLLPLSCTFHLLVLALPSGVTKIEPFRLLAESILSPHPSLLYPSTFSLPHGACSHFLPGQFRAGLSCPELERWLPSVPSRQFSRFLFLPERGQPLPLQLLLCLCLSAPHPTQPPVIPLLSQNLLPFLDFQQLHQSGFPSWLRLDSHTGEFWCQSKGQRLNPEEGGFCQYFWGQDPLLTSQGDRPENGGSCLPVKGACWLTHC